MLLSCQAPPAQDETSPDYTVPVGSALILHKAFKLLPGRTRALIQAGHYVDVIEFSDMFFPHCFFDINREAESSQVIGPCEFRVIRRQRAAVPEELVLANEFVVNAGDNGFIEYIHTTEIVLMSSAYLEGIKLVCQVLGGVLTEPLNIQTIRRTLGRLATLKLTNQT